MSADIHTLTGAYALDALPEDEREDFERHLEECGACRREVDEFRATASHLAFLGEEPAPSGLRDDVMAAVDQTRQEPPAIRYETSDDTVIDLPPRRTGWVQRLAAPAAAVLAILVVGLSVVLGNVNSRLDEVEQTVTAVSQVLTAPDAAIREVEVPDGGTARAVVSPSRSEAAFFVEGLDPTAEDKAYALWLIDDGEATPAGLFQVGEDRRATRLMTGDMRAVDAIGVTVEPASGSPQPTTDPVVLIEL